MKKIILILWLLFGANLTVNAQAPSIRTLVKAFQSVTSSNPKPVTYMLENTGYTYRFESKQSDYFNGTVSVYGYSKNCKIVNEEYGNGLEYSPSAEKPTSSIVILKAQGYNILSMEVQIYSHSVFNTWVSQLKALGYRTTSNSGEGNRGRDWEYVAKGKPTITIWNDYSHTYVLSMQR